MISITKAWLVMGTLCLLIFCTQILASTKAQLQGLLPQVKSIAAQSDIISAVDAANQAHANLSAAQIRTLGREWHAGLHGQSSQVLSEVNASSLSATLKNIQNQSNGTYTGILVTDAKGLVIGQTYNADHYSQANRSIWRNIAKDGVNAVYYGKAKKTDTGSLATLGLPIIENNKVIGAILVETKVVPDTAKARTKKSEPSAS